MFGKRWMRSWPSAGRLFTSGKSWTLVHVSPVRALRFSRCDLHGMVSRGRSRRVRLQRQRLCAAAGCGGYSGCVATSNGTATNRLWRWTRSRSSVRSSMRTPMRVSSAEESSAVPSRRTSNCSAGQRGRLRIKATFEGDNA